jgi:hypothetical protein
MTRAILALASDAHSNSTLGLCSPDATLPEGQPVPLTRAQLWLWQCWQDYLGRLLATFRRGDRVFGVHVGDGPDMNFRTSQLHTTDPSGAVSLFVETMRPLREICEDGFWVVRGTEAHGGDAGNLEELAARLLGATHYPDDSKLASCWMLRLLIEGVRVDLAHHGPAGRLPWTGPNGLGRVAYEIIDAYVRAGEPIPHLAVQGHNHKFYDTHENFPLRVLGLPCWQLQTSYGYKVSPRRTTDIGGVIVVLEDGRATVEPVLFPVKMEPRWASESS